MCLSVCLSVMGGGGGRGGQFVAVIQSPGQNYIKRQTEAFRACQDQLSDVAVRLSA